MCKLVDNCNSILCRESHGRITVSLVNAVSTITAHSTPQGIQLHKGSDIANLDGHVLQSMVLIEELLEELGSVDL